MNYTLAATLLCAALLAGCASPSSDRERGAPAAADSSAGNPPAAQASATAASTLASSEEPKERMVCKNVIPTGSRIGKRTCRTVRDWEQIQRDAREAAERVQRMGNQKPVPNG